MYTNFFFFFDRTATNLTHL